MWAQRYACSTSQVARVELMILVFLFSNPEGTKKYHSLSVKTICKALRIVFISKNITLKVIISCLNAEQLVSLVKEG